MKPFCAHFPLGKEQGRLAYCLRPSQRLSIAHILPTSFHFPANIHTNTGKAGKRREADFCSLMLNAKFELFPTARRVDYKLAKGFRNNFRNNNCRIPGKISYQARTESKANQQDSQLPLNSGTISNDAGRVKSFLISFLPCSVTPLSLRRTVSLFGALLDSERGMRPLGVVVSPPLLDHDLRLLQRVKVGIILARLRLHPFRRSQFILDFPNAFNRLSY